MKHKEILCAVDFSESSIDALKWAFDQARNSQSGVSILFCYRLIASMDDEDTLDLKRTIEEDATRKFKQVEAKILNGRPIAYKFIMEVGFYHFRIEMFLKSHPVGLLVLANSIIQNFDEYRSLGFEKFIQKTQVPVVIVPHMAEETIQI